MSYGGAAALANAHTSREPWQPFRSIGRIAVGADGVVLWDDQAYRLHGRPRWQRVRTLDDALSGVDVGLTDLRRAYGLLMTPAPIDDIDFTVIDDHGVTRQLRLIAAQAGAATIAVRLDTPLDPLPAPLPVEGSQPVEPTAAVAEDPELEPAFAVSPVAMAWLDGAGALVDINDAGARLFARSRSALLRDGIEGLDRLGTSPGRCRLDRADGTTIWLEANRTRHEGEGDPRELLTITDVTVVHDTEQQLRAQALYDELTGLPNRRLLMRLLDQALARSDRSGTRISVFFIDVDDLKRVNDTYGHDIGDELIIATSKRLRATLRDSDVLARLGGDEFVAVCEDEPDAGPVEEIGARLLVAASEPLILRGERQPVRLSIGAAIAAPHERDAAAYLARADAAMYRAKSAGGARVVTDVPSIPSARGPLPTVIEWLAAIEGGQLSLHYQPVISAADSSLLGFEGRLRWPHPRFGLLTVTDLLQTPGVSDVTDQLVRWAVRQGLTEVAELNCGPVSLWLVVPERAVLQPAVAADVAAAYRGLQGTDPPHLVLDRRERDVGAALRRHGSSKPIPELLAAGPVTTGLDQVRGDDLPIGAWPELAPVSLRLSPDLSAATDAASQTLVQALVRAAEPLRTIVISTHVDTKAALDAAIAAGVHAIQGAIVGPMQPITDLKQVWQRSP